MSEEESYRKGHMLCTSEMQIVFPFRNHAVCFEGSPLLSQGRRKGWI